MRKYFVIFASALGIVLLVILGVLAQRVLNLQSSVENLQEENTELRQKLALLSDSNTDSGNAEPGSDLSAAQPTPADAPILVSTQVVPVQTQVDSDTMGNAKIESASPFLRMFDSDEAIESNARMQVTAQYAQFLADLNLPADVDEHVRAILAESIAGELRLAVKAMQGVDKATIPADQSPEGLKITLRAELSKVLTADEMAAWEDYEANKPYYMMEQSYNMQLGMSAPTISEETRGTVSQVMAEEMILAFDDKPKTERFDVESLVAAQADAMGRALERLSPVLSDDEYRQVERFMEQQNESTRASQQMIRSMTGGDEGGASGSQER
ncbi:MAG: hypothetical protein KJ060_04075 [Candidatus Hydrogenedentes bacterium]|nr:hypothetical protein [Candidatus Hydrogenedentota bacterium]